MSPFYLSSPLCSAAFTSTPIVPCITTLIVHHPFSASRPPCASSPPFPASRPSLCIIPSFPRIMTILVHHPLLSPHHDPPCASSPCLCAIALRITLHCIFLHHHIIASFCITASLHHFASFCFTTSCIILYYFPASLHHCPLAQMKLAS